MPRKNKSIRPQQDEQPQMQNDHPDFCAPGVIVIWRQDCGGNHGINQTTVGPNMTPRIVVQALEEALSYWRRLLERETTDAQERSKLQAD